MATISSSAWTARRTGNLNKFYTRPEVGELLTAALGDISPSRIVDLGAGEGSLSLAVVRRWKDAEVTTVDLDDTCLGELHQRLLDAGVKVHEHRTLDVLDSSMPAELHDNFDLAVCNPPFYRPAWQRGFADILRAAAFAEACPSVTDATAEVLFFAQNLRLVREGGTIALIVPDGLATGWRARAFRKALVSQHTLESVIQLPPHSFADTEAYCFLLIVRKGKNACDEPVRLSCLRDDGTVSDAICIRAEEAETRLDWAFHSAAQSTGGSVFTLRSLSAEIRRGSLSSVERREAAFPVFHTGDFPALGEPVEFPACDGDLGQCVVAETGDILMARVDRDLHNKITFVANGHQAITDCIFRIRLPQEQRLKVFKAMTSETGRRRLQAATKGVGARLLGKGDLLDLSLPVVG